MRAMTKDAFWDLIGETRKECGMDMDHSIQRIQNQLTTLGPQYARDFGDILHGYQELADQYGLWSAASILCDGCSDDGFLDFRSWLIAQGREVYLAALENPDSLADVERYGYCQFEDLSSIGSITLAKLTGQSVHDGMDSAEYAGLLAELERDIVYGKGIGYPYQWDEVAEYLPRLCARYHLTSEELTARAGSDDVWNLDNEEIQAARAASPQNVGPRRPENEAAAQSRSENNSRRNDMQTPPKAWLEFMREQYPAGSRIKLRQMGNDPDPVPSGSMGTLQAIDDIGTFHVSFDNGRSLGLILGEDSFSVLPPPTQTLKLYMPMTVGYYDNDGYLEEEITLDSRDAVEYAPHVIAAMQRENRLLEKHATAPEKLERGLMAYYGADDGVDRKVRSYTFDAEVRDGRLWGVAVCKVQGQLTPEEMDLLKENVTAQAADGYGESAEQHEISVGGGLEIYAHLWQDHGWSIMTEQERFDPKFLERLPELCFSTLASTGALICIKRGESGYYPSDWDTGDPAQNKELADYNNQRLGVTAAQRKAMEAGSMHGWSCPAADPKTYEQHSFQMGGLS